MKDYRLYVLMRNDLPSMNMGRALAQANHAGTAIVFEHGSSPEVQEWQRQTPQGFGTAIVLTGDRDEINSVLEKATERNLINNRVVDPDWKMEITTEVFELIDSRVLNKVNDNGDIALPGKNSNHLVISKEEWACAYVFGEFEQTYWVLGRLPLHP